MKFREPAEAEPMTVGAVTCQQEPSQSEWQVSGADGALSNRVKRFSGADAMIRSLTYAHNEYPRVRWLMR